jgi:TRAP-type C4-dicarboxylate transport system substrate-binding protein
MNVKNVVAGAALFALSLTGSSIAISQEAQTFKVVGTWSHTSAWQSYERPFWAEWLPEASGGKLKGNPISMTDAGLKGYEIVRLLKLGVFDFAHGLIGYVSEGNGLIEGGDLAGMAQDFDTLRKVLDAYRPTLDATFRQNFGARIIAMNPWPPSMLFCTKPVKGLGDFKGKKIRIHSASLGDYVEGAGGTSVTMPLGEVLPALERGVVDCAITDAMTAYRSKWHEVVRYVVPLKLAYSVSFTAVNESRWNSLDPKTREIMEQVSRKMEEKAWANAMADDAQGVQCMTTGPCTAGRPGGATLVVIDEAGQKLQREILDKAVLARWAKRCPQCVDTWNNTAGKAAGLTAPKS